jgi:hypothetical protein
MKQDKSGHRADWRADLRQMAKQNRKGELTRIIYTGPTIYLPAITGVYPAVNQPADIMPMFEEQDQAVYTVFFDGAISVTLHGILDKHQVKAFIVGAHNIPGVKSCAIDDCQAHSSENTCFIVDMRPGVAVKANEIRLSIQAYAARFMSDLKPTAVQTGLF